MRKPINHLFCSCSSGLFAAIPLTQSLSLVKKNTCPLILTERGHFVLTNHSKSKQEYFVEFLKLKN